MSNIFSAFKMAFKSMRANKGRTSLTILGIVIGIASIIIVYSAGEGIKGLLVSQVEAFGTNIIQSEIKVPTTKKGSSGDTQSATAMASGVQVTSMKLKDLEDIKKLSNITSGYGAVLSQEKISYGNESRKAFLFGVSPDYINIDSSEVEFGRFFSDEEDKSLSQVVVLGSKMKEKLFGDADALGQYVSLRHSKFLVIGVMKSRGGGLGMDFDDYVYMPLRTLQKKIMGIDYVMYMIHEVKDMTLAADTAEEIRLILRDNHKITDPIKDDFRVSTMEDMMAILNTVTDAITILLLAIVIISLIVGGVGILNIMYVIVSERTMEIGLRKAVGANYRNIMTQFLAESVLITLLGGVVGVLVGIVFSFLISVGANYANLDWLFVIPFKSLVVAFFFSLVFGIFFGVYPARKAARLDPIEALRKE
ncbi:MAG TPA: ABC transporter permease [bacterium]|nr:ABC transporter permease [bacterium]